MTTNGWFFVGCCEQAWRIQVIIFVGTCGRNCLNVRSSLLNANANVEETDYMAAERNLDKMEVYGCAKGSIFH